jgi:hypothetical protein
MPGTPASKKDPFDRVPILLVCASIIAEWGTTCTIRSVFSIVGGRITASVSRHVARSIVTINKKGA